MKICQNRTWKKFVALKEHEAGHDRKHHRPFFVSLSTTVLCFSVAVAVPSETAGFILRHAVVKDGQFWERKLQTVISFHTFRTQR